MLEKATQSHAHPGWVGLGWVARLVGGWKGYPTLVHSNVLQPFLPGFYPAIVERPDSPYRQDADDQKAIKKHKVLFKGKFFFKVQVSMRNAATARTEDRIHMMLWRAGVPGVSMPTQCIGG